MASITAQQLNVFEPCPSWVTEDKRALDAFFIMRKENATFVPILSEDNDLLSIVSARDMKALAVNPNISSLLSPVLDFVSASRQSTPDDKYPYIWCKQDSSMDLILKRLKATHVHRLVCINDKKQPIGVVTVQGIVTALTK